MSEPQDLVTHSLNVSGEATVNSSSVPLSQASRYVIGEEIARGGMGEVYRATDTVLNREVAVKVLHAKYGPDSPATRRFADEARITGQLQHPAIPPVHDLGTLPDGRPFLAMKLIKGNTLERLLKARSSPDEGRGLLIAVFEQICQAIAYAHAHDVIHRDLKPANIMVGSFGEVQVMDWGLAKVMATATSGGRESDPETTAAETEIKSLRDSDGSFTQAGSILGTPAFMPPEQAVGAVSSIDTRSDVFGLGAILAVILTGSPPFVASSAETTRVKAAQGDVAECFAKLDLCGAEPELIDLCKRCLSPKQDDRPKNAEAVASSVAEHRAAAAERARQAELDSVKSAEQRKRRRTQFVLAAVALILLAAVGVGSALASLWRNAEDAKGKALAAQEETEAARERLARVEYGRTMQVAYQEYRENNVGAARKLLESTRPDLRGWEYHHVHRLCSYDLFTLKGLISRPESSMDGKRILAPQVSMDGKRILTLDEVNQVRLSDSESGKEMLRIKDAQFAALSRDGTRIAVVGTGCIRIHDSKSGENIRTLPILLQATYALDFSPNGHQLAVGAENVSGLWDVETGTEILKILCKPDDHVCFAFSPDSLRVVIAGPDLRVTIRDSKTGKELFACPAGKEEIMCLRYSPDGTRIASAGDAQTVRVWDAKTGAQEHDLKVERGKATDVCFSPDGRTLAAAAWLIDTPFMWDMATGRELPTIHGHSGGIRSLAFSRDGTRLITSGHDGTCRVWDLKSNKEVLVLKGHADTVNSAAYLPGENRIVSTSLDLTTKIWDARVPSEKITRFDLAERYPSDISADGSRMLCSEPDKTASICDTVTGQRLVHLNEVHSGIAYGGTFSADGSRVFTTDGTNTVRIWDSHNGALIQLLRIPFDAKQGMFGSGKLNPNGTKYVSSATDKLVRMWDVASGTQLYDFPANQQFMDDIQFDPTGERFVNCSSGSMDVRDTRTGERVTELRLGTDKESDQTFSLRYNRKGTKLITAHSSGLARVWDARTGEVLLTLRGHSRILIAADFSPDGTRIVTAGDDKTLRVWDAATGIEVLTLRGHTDQVIQARFTSDGTRIISLSTDNTIRIWDSRPFRETRLEQKKKNK
jgi:WD40 repeat protein/serine/threonine protein kinase